MSYSRHSRHCYLPKRWCAILGAILLAIFISLFFYSKSFALEAQNNVNLYLFWGNGCPHCAHAKEVLEPFIKDNKYVTYNTYEVYYSTENQKKMQDIGEKLNIGASGVPLIIVGDKPYIGFSDTTGTEIKKRLEYCSINACPDSVASIVGVEKPEAKDYAENKNDTQSTNIVDDKNQSDTKRPDKIIELPLIGKINAANFSLPALAVIIGLLDGFNPCAMWALLFIITLLIGMNDRKRMWLYGTTFIGVSALIYLGFMAAWLNLFLFIGNIVWIRAAIGVFALAIGGYYLYDWYQNKTGCKVTNNEKRKAVFTKLRTLIKEKNIWIGLVGIAVLAAAVNVVELACSAGLPVLYTGILSSASMQSWQYFGYMLLYVLFFMLDDLIVFGIAMKTMQVIGIESKYTRITRLVGGILMLVLGMLLIFAPQVLMFG